MTIDFFLPKIFQKKNLPEAVDAFIPSFVLVPLKQEKDFECVPCVESGQIVNEGEVIAFAKNESTRANIHAPIPGIVQEFLLSDLPNGSQEVCVKIAFRGSFSYLAKNRSKTEWNFKLPGSILGDLAAKGVINTFSTSSYRSLAYNIDSLATLGGARLLVVRLFDESPGRYVDSILYKSFSEEVMAGAEIVAYAMNAAGVVFLYDKSSQEHPEKFFKHTVNVPVAYVSVDGKRYLSGFKQEIVQSILSAVEEHPFNKVSDEDVFVDPSTLLAVHGAVAENTPVVRQHVFVDGDCVPACGLINVTLGMSIRYALEQCGNLLKEPHAIIINGIMTGTSTPSLDTPITKNVKSITVLSSKSVCDELEADCINCGHCRRACPYGLAPDILYHVALGQQKVEQFLRQSAAICTLCNVCNVVCPARLPLCQTIAPLVRSEIEKQKSNLKR